MQLKTEDIMSGTVVVDEDTGRRYLLVPLNNYIVDIGAVSIFDVIEAVAACSGYSVKSIISDRRPHSLAIVRQTAYWLAREHTTASYPQIARCFGNRDHSTIIHGFRNIDSILGSRAHQDYPRVSGIIDEVERGLTVGR